MANIYTLNLVSNNLQGLYELSDANGVHLRFRPESVEDAIDTSHEYLRDLHSGETVICDRNEDGNIYFKFSEILAKYRVQYSVDGPSNLWKNLFLTDEERGVFSEERVVLSAFTGSMSAELWNDVCLVYAKSQHTVQTILNFNYSTNEIQAMVP